MEQKEIEKLAKEIAEANKKFPKVFELVKQGKRYSDKIYLTTIYGIAEGEVQIATEKDVTDAMQAAGADKWSELSGDASRDKIEKFNRALASKLLVLPNPSELEAVLNALAPGEAGRIAARGIELGTQAQKLEKTLEWFRSQPGKY